MDLVNDKVEKLPVTAAIFTHSHVDHFAGLRAIVDEKDVKAGKVPVIAPEGFMEEAVSENVFAGNVMSRRASFMYGNLLPKDPQGNTSSATLAPMPLVAAYTASKQAIEGFTGSLALELRPSMWVPSWWNPATPPPPASAKTRASAWQG